MRGGRGRGAILAAAGLAFATPASATTLADALSATYVNNPTLAAQRAGLRATDEQYGIVRAQGLLNAGINGQLTQGVRNYQQFNGFGRITQAGAQLSVPVWQGGRVKSALRAADARVKSGQQSLRATEGDVFVQAVSAYMDVLRDRAIVDLNLNNVKVLETNLQATNDRFQAGDLTRTDVAQSKARLEGARGQLAAARATLTSSEENYRATIGQPAGVLEQPPVMPLPEGSS
jgi:outer membrane protein